jgi:hypothetical protein
VIQVSDSCYELSTLHHADYHYLQTCRGLGWFPIPQSASLITSWPLHNLRLVPPCLDKRRLRIGRAQFKLYCLWSQAWEVSVVLYWRVHRYWSVDQGKFALSFIDMIHLCINMCYQIPPMMVLKVETLLCYLKNFLNFILRIIFKLHTSR